MGAQWIIVAGLLGIIAIAAPIPLRSAQQTPPLARPSFDVASVKQSKSLDAGGTLRFSPAGQIAARNMPLRGLIAIAYELRTFQLVGGPGWIDDRFDIDAKPEGTASREQVLLMMQTLLAERFKLSGHREARDVDGFILARVRSDRLGSNLQPSALDCLKLGFAPARCKEGGIRAGSFKGVGRSISTLLDVVIGEVRAPVADNTQLTGTFDVDLQWSPDVTASSDLPSIFTALQEQLGLKLESKRVSTAVFVIDHVEPATPD